MVNPSGAAACQSGGGGMISGSQRSESSMFGEFIERENIVSVGEGEADRQVRIRLPGLIVCANKEDDVEGNDAKGDERTRE